MKKLVIAMAVVASAIIANAATIKWNSGAVQLPGEDGTLNGVKLTDTSGYNLKMYAFESLSAISYSAGDIYSWYDKGATGKFNGLDAVTGTVTMGASATTAVVNGTLAPATDGTTVYGAVLFVLEDATTGDAKWYMENDASKASGKAVQTVANLSLKVGGLSTGSATAWTAVPEPTSGLLLLLGMAGLALKRKRA